MLDVRALIVEKAKAEQRRRKQDLENKKRAEESLYEFMKLFWHVVEPVHPFIDSWVIDGICQHLEAVTDGRITRIIMNVPPGLAKSLTTDVFWPAWEHGPQNMPHLRYICTSSQNYITERDNGRYLRIINDPLYQRFWGDRFSLVNTGVSNITNDKTGFKLATSIGADAVGKRGNRVILDDANSTDPKRNESETQREAINLIVTESLSDRLNSVEKDAIVVIQQRTNERDVSGTLLDKDKSYVHFCVPMEYDPTRHCTTEIGWTDPRQEEGELCFPERFSRSVVENLKKTKGDFAWSGQYQQAPAPRGGGIIKTEHWNLWDEEYAVRLGLQNQDDALTYPRMEFVIASLDSAYTEDKENDFSALTVWGVWRNEYNVPKVMLMDAWEQRLELHGRMPEKPVNQSVIEYLRENKQYWGLVERVCYTCKRFKVDTLLIENKASGKSVAQEMRRLFAEEQFGVVMVDPVGDKVARAYACQPTFSSGTVYAPDRAFADKVIDRCAAFPKCAALDLVDSVTQAINWLRDTGWALRSNEADRIAEREASLESTRDRVPIYDV